MSHAVVVGRSSSQLPQRSLAGTPPPHPLPPRDPLAASTGGRATRTTRTTRIGRGSGALATLLVVASVGVVSVPSNASAAGPLLSSRAVPQKLTGSSEDRARAVLVARDPTLAQADLRLIDVLPVGVKGAFTMVRFGQHAGDLTVLGKGARVLLTKDGQATALVTADVAEDVRALPKPTLTIDAAAKLASTFANTSFGAADGRLLAYPLLDGTRVAYAFYRGVLPGEARAPMVIVDALDGRMLGRRELGHTAKSASVYVPNPVTAKLPSDVTLDLPDGATTLDNATFTTKSCVDKGKVVDAGQNYTLHVCDFEAKALADADGNFPYKIPDVQENDDPFSEVSAFYHTTRAAAYLGERGMPSVVAPFLIAANFRVANGDIGNPSKASDPLEPYANAFFAPADPSFEFLFDIKNAGLFLGQAQHIDFSYDGDVVYHEFGHALVDRTAKLDGEWKLDTQGATPDPGAMNEGIGDTVSSWIAGDPNVGEYGSEEGGIGEASIRNIANTRKCPDDLIGEAHEDSLYFSGALWAARETAFADPDSRLVFETAVITALAASPTTNLGISEYLELLVTALTEAKVDSAKIDQLKQAFADRGFGPDCKRVFEWTGSPISSTDDAFYNFFFMPGTPYIKSGTTPYAPGLFQIHAKLPAGTTKINVGWESYPYPGGYGGSPKPQVLVRYGAEAITFKPKGTFSSTAEDPVSASGPKSGQGHLTASLQVPEGETEAWIMLVNAGYADSLYGQIGLTFTKGAVTGKGGSGGAAGGAVGGGSGAGGSTIGTGGVGGLGVGGANAIGDPAATPQALPHPEGGCAVASVGASDSMFAGVLAALGLAGLAFGRKKRAARF
jgi:hypothetical protein